jgi:hypothetical protein
MMHGGDEKRRRVIAGCGITFGSGGAPVAVHEAHSRLAMDAAVRTFI